jgi:hypothetical protein
MPIDALDSFASRFKTINDSHVESYDNTAPSIIKWTDSDFTETTDAIIKGLDISSKIFMVSAIKKSYDLVKGYHRAYRMHNLTKDDYYQAAIHDRKKDSVIIDRIVSATNIQYDRHASVAKIGVS